jgi:hypothetical protein
LYARVSNADGESIPGANFSPEVVMRPQVTDSFGRWQGLFGGAHDLTFTKPGFEPTKAHIQCKMDEEVDLPVVMQKVTQ